MGYNDAASPQQVDYLKSLAQRLGDQANAGLSKGEAHNLIERALHELGERPEPHYIKVPQVRSASMIVSSEMATSAKLMPIETDAMNAYQARIEESKRRQEEYKVRIGTTWKWYNNMVVPREPHVGEKHLTVWQKLPGMYKWKCTHPDHPPERRAAYIGGSRYGLKACYRNALQHWYNWHHVHDHSGEMGICICSDYVDEKMQVR